MVFKEVLPRKGLLYQEDNMPLALCRPKLMPLKSVTLEKLEEMQKSAIEKTKQQQQQQQQQLAQGEASTLEGSRVDIHN
ncbi:BBSome-interacting protein 1 [Armadillidium nasatum]|uniref:BBSome-interacting protein 1 n=1 Tax=Armadillidium nasatum TaxID=96803 RepID=A0A5N5SNE7_9CRUS|nr:BBSome-interacting protein 1 [Armadillidium nasatum]